MREIHRRPVNSPHKWPVTRKRFPFDDIIMMLWREHYRVSYDSLVRSLTLRSINEAIQDSSETREHKYIGYILSRRQLSPGMANWSSNHWRQKQHYNVQLYCQIYCKYRIFYCSRIQISYNNTCFIFMLSNRAATCSYPCLLVHVAQQSLILADCN